VKDEKELKISRAWEEAVLFVDCPACQEGIELGSGVIIPDGGCEQECPKCKAVFRVLGPDSR
jgi:hypothetical protein